MSETNYEIASKDAAILRQAPSVNYLPRDPENKDFKVGLIACGGITEAHLKAYKKAGYNVVALCDLDIEKAASRRDQFYPAAEIFSDHRELISRSEINVVDIAAHPDSRYSIIVDALNAGKHVLSQKPFVTDLDLGEQLVKLAKERNLRLAVNQNGRWAPHFSYMRGAISDGIIGEVQSIEMGVHWDHEWIIGTPFDDIFHVVLYDFGIHWFDILSCFMGSKTATRVYASITRADSQSAKPPLLGQVLVEYPGAQATLSFSAATKFGALDSTTISGSKGTLKSTGPDLGNQTVTIITEEGSATPELEGTWFTDGFHGTMGELLRAIEEGREPSNSAENNLRSLALCFAALKSSETGQPFVPGEIRSVENKEVGEIGIK